MGISNFVILEKALIKADFYYLNIKSTILCPPQNYRQQKKPLN